MTVSDARLAAIALSVPDGLTLPTVDDLAARTRAMVAENDPRVRVRRIGASADGEPIEMISIGRGARSALVVGTPHPNEPIGCLTIEFLIDLLRRDDALREELGLTWHFIKTIEPDGLRANEGWLSRPFDVAVYLRHFFRPAAREQAEYCFPIDVEGYRFDASTPENRAWQEAVRLTSPGLLYSLHNCEFGGAFYMLSRPHAALAARLTRQPEVFGMPLDTFGEAIEGEKSDVPGVFAAFDPEAVLRAERGEGRGGALAYNAGQSSFGYFCRPQGTLGLIAEAPHWRATAASLRDSGDGSVAETQQAIRRLGRDVVRLLDRHLPELPTSDWRYARRYRASLVEMRAYAELGSRIVLPWNLAMPWATIACKRQATLLNLLRPVGMLVGLAHGVLSIEAGQAGASSTRLAAERLLTGALQQYGLVDAMEAVPLKQSVGIQVLAGLQAAALLP